MASDESSKGINAYATLLTRPNYLAGTILLAYTLYQHSPSTPLVVLYTPTSLPEESVQALRAEAQYSNVILYLVEHLRLPVVETNGTDAEGMVAERFIDTWTKLRVFEVLEVEGKKVDRLCFLDADMMIFSDPSPLIFNVENDEYLRGGDAMRVCASHVCVCNLDGDAWAPASWTKDNCAFTHLRSPHDIPPVKSSPETMAIFNSGTFVFHPSPQIRSSVFDAFNDASPAHLRALKFPDQDFLNEVFMGRWASLSWRTNALKTWRDWHPNIWRDDEVAVLHYIVDKPWAARVVRGGEGEEQLRAGYKGLDGVTHSWWWNRYEAWKEERQKTGTNGNNLLQNVSRYVASADGNGDDASLSAIGGGAQDFARKWEGKSGEGEKKGVEKGEKEQDEPQGPHGPILRKPMLGERGHGPVVRGGSALSGRGNKRGFVRPNGASYMEP